ncbi:MAG: DUF6531 domain-containing protein, partial [Gammaproteobacteria bacterium]
MSKLHRQTHNRLAGFVITLLLFTSTVSTAAVLPWYWASGQWFVGDGADVWQVLGAGEFVIARGAPGDLIWSGGVDTQWKPFVQSVLQFYHDVHAACDSQANHYGSIYGTVESYDTTSNNKYKAPYYLCKNGPTRPGEDGYWANKILPGSGIIIPKNILGTPPPPSNNPKNLGKPRQCTGVGDPCNSATGNEFQEDTDYRGPSGTLSFTRAYNSLDVVDHGLGYGWVSNVGRHLAIDGNSLTVNAADGRGEPFTLSNGVWQGDADTKLQLTQDASGYTVQHQDGRVDHFDTDGRLVSSMDAQGRTTTDAYDSNGHVTTVTGPFGHELGFTYNSDGRLATFTDPAGNVTQYSYDS